MAAEDGGARARAPLAAEPERAPDGIRVTIRSGSAAGTGAELRGARILIGRGEDCDLVVPDPKASRHHAAVEPVADARGRLVDLGSGNGTYVNGRRVESAELDGHEQIQIGDTVLVSSRGDPPPGLGTMIGDAPPSKTRSLVQRLALQRSVRRATAISGAAAGLAAVLAVLLVTGILAPGADELNSAVARAVRVAEPGTVVIDPGDGGDRNAGGTGWVLDAGAGLIVTNAHVVDGRADVKVGAGKRLRKATVIATAPCEDLAVLRAESLPGMEALRLGRQSDLRRGQTVVALGYPADASLETNLTVTTGVVSVPRTAYRERTLDIPRFPNVIQTDAAINPGNSGGPLLDLDGRLVGVTSAGRTLTPDGRIIQGQSYAIGVDRVREVTQALRAGRSIGSLGVSFEYLSSSELRRRDLPPGLPIEEVARGSAAERAGLVGGHLVAIGGKAVDSSLASYCDAVRGLRPGSVTTVSVLPAGSSRPRAVRLRLE